MAAGTNGVAEGLGAAAAGSAAAAGEVFRDLSEIPFGRIAFVAFVAWLLARAVGWALPRFAEALPGRFRVRVLPWVPVLRLAIVVAAIVVIVPMAISPTPQNLFATLGALGIALGFAFKDLASSLVAGVVAVFERPYRQGDWIRVGGDYGEVRTVGLRAVTLVTPADDVVTVPHDVLWTDHVVNSNDGQRTLMVVTRLFLHPDHDGRRMRERLHEVIWTSPWLDPSRPILVHVVEEAWGTRYELKAYPLDARDQFAFRSDLTLRAKEVAAQLGARYVAAPVAAPGGAASAVAAGPVAASEGEGSSGPTRRGEGA